MMPQNEGSMFYGIRYSESHDESEDESPPPPRVLPYDASLLKDVLKQHKSLKPRFKIFRSKDEAQAFASSPRKEEEDSSSESKKVPSGNAECPYSSLTPQELTAFRKDLESCAMEAISLKISENPRYLVSVSTDTPSIIHSGMRSNALHTCAKVGDPHIVTFLLETLESQTFLESLYPKESEESRKQRGNHLLDNYLNIPQKASNETPLHIASKYGHLSVVKILVSYSQCIIQPRNKFGDTPEDIACSRAPDGERRKSLIIEAIKGRVYIPIYRSLEYGGSIGEPWSPSTPSKKLFDTSDFSPVRSPYRSPHKKSPLVVLPSVNKDNYSLCDGPKRVSGLLGPISPVDAPKLKKEWKMSGSKTRLNDPNRGFEKQGREIAKKYGIDWREYWEFLDAYVDFSTQEGLVALEDYLEDAAQHFELDHNQNDSSEVANLSYGFEELEIGNVEDPKSPMSALTEEFQELTLNSPTKPLRNPLITNFNRNIKKEKQSFYNEVNNELTNISEQVLLCFKDYEDDMEEVYHFVMSVFCLPLSIFKRKINNWRLDNRPFYCEESTLLEHLSIKVSNMLSMELNKEELSDFADKLERFPKFQLPTRTKITRELNDSYRSTNTEEEEEENMNRMNYHAHRDDVLPFVALVLEGFNNSNDKNANELNSMPLLEYDAKITQTKDIFQNLSLSEAEDSCSEETFLTAESEWDRASFETATNFKEFYIYGKEPSQTDLEVYLALEGVDTSSYPFISTWRDRIEEYDLAARGAWPTKVKNLEESINISRFDLDQSLDFSF